MQIKEVNIFFFLPKTQILPLRALYRVPGVVPGTRSCPAPQPCPVVSVLVPLLSAATDLAGSTVVAPTLGPQPTVTSLHPLTVPLTLSVLKLPSAPLPYPCLLFPPRGAAGAWICPFHVAPSWAPHCPGAGLSFTERAYGQSKFLSHCINCITH